MKLLQNSSLKRKDLQSTELNLDDQLIEKINKFAPIKYIFQNKSKNEHQVMELFGDIVRDLNNYDLEYRIQEL